ncbi:hypothetical protein JGI17_11341, partial [Candidatus Kryptonium thompsonii]
QGDVVNRRNITIGRKFDGEVEVLSGISENEMVVITGQTKLSDGTKVKVIE